ncbi:S8 family serine peptidase [Planctomicrobium piriforme]|uniref:S8 family serine peptidase n=1 Tax=Planctomicrobium piriforme TaxID=1576369 RepID=UPI0011140AA4|nr:S8 family serine peptidase [Planctomicrobium piriforme]
MWNRAKWGLAIWLLIVPAGYAWEESPVPKPSFPTIDLLPKTETGALRFLKEHPHYDGRGVIVAIFDTGVDPAATGLQTTTDGKPKILDLIDGTGSGDVPLKEAEPVKEGTLVGATGRTLKIDPRWKNPTGKYRIGLKAGYDLFPPELVERLTEERREQFAKGQRKLEAQLRDQLVSIEEGTDKSLSKDECEARLKCLTEAWEGYADPGPVYDCAVFHDGDVFRAVVDTDEDGDLADEKVLTDYAREHRYAVFSDASRLSFSVQILDDGHLLSLVTASGEHGTHVAGIVAAHDSAAPERNGLAPGAQIISINIGDPRIDTMETGAALLRGLNAAVNWKCDLINMSYGEPTTTPNHGALVSKFREIVREKNVIFVAAAGNEGPALSTVGAPGGTTSEVIGVGAYVSPAMMKAGYGLAQAGQGQAYTWASRGPTTDGDWGVDLFAPGAAIAPIPHYSLQQVRHMNGTSMASPNACGNIALLVSGLKQKQAAFTPTSILRSLQATAERIPGIDLPAQGPGLVQIDQAFVHHVQWGNSPGQNVPLHVSLLDRNNARGVYLRDPHETDRIFEGDLMIEPKFSRTVEKELPLQFQMPLVLKSTADWVTVGEHLLLTKDGEMIPIKVDPTKLEPGLHIAEVLGYVADAPERGPVLRVPVVVTRPPQAAGQRWETVVESQSGEITRNFLAVPAGSRTATVRLTRVNGSEDGERIFMLHAVQLVPGWSFEHRNFKKGAALAPGEKFEATFPVTAERTLEVCLAQYWSDRGTASLKVEVEFIGLDGPTTAFELPSDGSAAALTVSSRLAVEKCEPSASLDHWERIVPPHSAKLHLLKGARNELWDEQRLSQLVLTYELELSSKGNVTLACPELQGLLYDSPVSSYRMFVFNADQELVHMEHTDPQPFELPKGTYTVKVELRDLDRSRLEPFEAMVLTSRQRLSSPITVPVDRNRPDAVEEKNEFEKVELAPGTAAVLFLKFPHAAELPDDIQTGDRLTGTLHFTKARNASVPLVHNYVAGSDDSAGESDGKAASDKSSDKKFDVAGAELEFWLTTLRARHWPQDKDVIDQLLAKVLERDPQNLEARVIKLHLIDNDDREERLPEVVAAATEVLALIPVPALKEYFGTRHASKTPEEKALNKQRETQKKQLVDALYRKGRALGHMDLPENLEKHPIADRPAHDKAFAETVAELANWVDLTEKEYVLLQVRKDRRAGDFGEALKLLDQEIAADPLKKLYQEKRAEVYEQLGWKEWEQNQQRWLLRRFPASEAAF